MPQIDLIALTKGLGYTSIVEGILHAKLNIGFIEESMCALKLVVAPENKLVQAYAKWEFSKEKGKYEGEITKSITLFYTDKGEYYNLLPIANEAETRGYKVKFTDDIFERAEIGIYCQHVCHPENAKFSLILLHDMAQGHNRWSNLWELEQWNEFDIGILPGETWARLWKQCGELYYANPRRGVYAFGYPKSDIVISEEVKTRSRLLKEELGLKYDFSVLYAPSWENDEKEDDFVLALASLPVNLLIKQAHWSTAYQFVIDNIGKMRALHEGKYENVYYIDPKESIMTALELCDMVVSDESSVMAEAVLFNKISVAVTDWTIPDTVPPRLACVPMNYVIRCKKVELRECVDNIYHGRLNYELQLKMGREIFGNQGSVCKYILDAIDYYLGFANDEVFKKFRLIPDYLPVV
ncbi:MAG: CDP-glycerol glycerophosphotransferase family protein [Lachnospiraceae bacterium]|nr:CDP-glycerol glycerophosphotransferase family protein [Lachnospiraceae bacterium]